MVDMERVDTLDELMERVPEDLVRDAETRRIEKETLKTKEAEMSKEPSKAKRIREYLDKNPGARNKEAVATLGGFGVTAADVANVKSHMKRTEGKATRGRPPKAKPAVAAASTSTAIATNGPIINWKELEAGVAFVKAAKSVQRAQHLLIIIGEIKEC
jgi:hypothetical protein